MGTRNLTVVISGGTHRIAQYGQWDGYPDGNGKTVLEFVRERLTSKGAIETFTKAVGRARFMTDNDRAKVDEFLESIGCKDGWMTMEQSAQYKARFPLLSRDVGAKILTKVADASVDEDIMISDNIDFAGDSLFCEWAYVVDLDAKRLEAYRGFNRQPVPDGERFANAPRDESGHEDYYQVKLAGSWSFDALPSNEDFIAHFKEAEEEGEAA